MEEHCSAVAPSSVLVPATALLVRVRAEATPSSRLAFESILQGFSGPLHVLRPGAVPGFSLSLQF